MPYRGNPLAVVGDATGLTTEEMQRVAAWMNLSETTFLLEPCSENSATADYRVRIFTPDRELPFAGHPTLGSCAVWLEQGGVPRTPGVIVQECGAGLVQIRSSHNSGSSAGNNPGTSPDSPGNNPGNNPRNSPENSPGSSSGSSSDSSPGNSLDSSRLAFAAPPLVRSGPVSADDLAAACALLRIDPNTQVVNANWVDNGPPWLGLLLRSAEDVLNLRPEAANPHDLFVGAVGPYPPGSAADSADPAADPANPADSPDFEVRAFFPVRGALAEDPVTGSLNASLGQWLTAAGHATAPYVASQGAALGRDGRVYIDRDPDGTIWVGGAVVTCIQGTVEI